MSYLCLRPPRVKVRNLEYRGANKLRWQLFVFYSGHGLDCGRSFYNRTIESVAPFLGDEISVSTILIESFDICRTARSAWQPGLTTMNAYSTIYMRRSDATHQALCQHLWISWSGKYFLMTCVGYETGLPPIVGGVSDVTVSPLLIESPSEMSVLDCSCNTTQKYVPDTHENGVHLVVFWWR